MFEAFFTDPCMRYRTEVINGIDFYGLGFSMVRGECVAEGTLRWMQKGEAAAVLITNTSLPDMSGFELARHVRRQFPCLRVIFLTDTPNLAEAQQDSGYPSRKSRGRADIDCECALQTR